jgi:hypothetical protein
LLLGMLLSVELDNQSLFKAAEVDDETSNTVLSSKLASEKCASGDASKGVSLALLRHVEATSFASESLQPQLSVDAS